MKNYVARICIIAIIAAVVGFSAASLTMLYFVEKDNSVPAVAAAEYTDALVQFSIEHDQLRSMQLQGLDDIINSEKTERELIDSAQQQKLELLKYIETEQTITAVLRARGFTDAAVTAAREHVNILIRASQAGQDAVSRILELVNAETGLNAENIKIIPIN